MNSKQFSLSLAAAFVLSMSLPAQRCVYHPDSSASSGGNNVIPFGNSSPTWQNQRYQTLIPTSALGSQPGLIHDIAFSPANQGTYYHGTLLIRMTQTNLSTLSGNLNFDQNLGSNATTVLSVADHNWYPTANTWSRIGLQRSFLYIPARGNLLIDILQTGASYNGASSGGFRSKSIERLYAVNWTGQPPATGSHGTSAGIGIELCFDTFDHATFGNSCSGSRGVPRFSFGGSAKIGQSTDLMLSGAPRTPPVAVLILGFNNGAPVFPVTITGSCKLYISPDIVIPVPVLTGTASLKIANPNAVGLRYYAQYATLDANANPSGLVTTNYGRVLVGN